MLQLQCLLMYITMWRIFCAAFARTQDVKLIDLCVCASVRVCVCVCDLAGLFDQYHAIQQSQGQGNVTHNYSLMALINVIIFVFYAHQRK